jgi:succinoglycan biosynthesis transport protein ExoP
MSNDLPTVPDPARQSQTVQLTPHQPSSPQRLETMPPAGEGTVNWRRYVAAIQRFKWLALLVIIGGTAAGIGLSRLMTPQYTAHATVWVEDEKKGQAGPIRPSELLQSAAWIELFRSYAVLDPVVEKQRLYVQMRTPIDTAATRSFRLTKNTVSGPYKLAVDKTGQNFELSARNGTVVQRGRVGEVVGTPVGFEWQPPASVLQNGRTIEFTVSSPRAAAMELLSRMNIRMDKQGNFLRVSLSGTDPQRVAATLNAVTDQFIDVAAELKRAKLEELTNILQEQLQYAQRNLQQSEAALEGFRVQTVTLPSERPVAAGLEVTRDPVFTGFFGLRIEQEQLQRDREAIRRAQHQLGQGALPIAALEVIPSVQASSEIKQVLNELASKRAEVRALQSRYTNEAPAVRKLLDDIQTLEQQTIPRMIAALQTQLAAREAEIERRVASASGELRQIPTRAIEEQRLARERASAENLFTRLQNAYEETRLATASSIPDVRVLDRAAVPQTPDNQGERTNVILMALLGSLGLAVAGSILLDRVDPRLRYPEQVTQEMGLNILGAVPHVGPTTKRRLGGDNTAHVVEAFREVRLNVAHAHGTAGPLVVTITSPGVGDGKSFVASNLALAFADQGYRTLLIDGDIRRGGLHRLFERSRKPGLTDYLSGKVSREEVVQQTAYPTLHLIAGGTRTKGGPELLGAPAMAMLLAELRSSYSVILIDSPPLGAGVDPFALGALSGNLVLVLRTGNTNRELAGAKLDLIDRLPIRILGAVLNDVPNSGVYRYYSYLSGYEARDEGLLEEGNEKQLQGV